MEEIARRIIKAIRIRDGIKEAIDVLPYVGDGTDATTIFLARQALLVALDENTGLLKYLGEWLASVCADEQTVNAYR